jgi:predicted RNA binding protein YcfA (HicA-like mRNA interferase family)
LSKLPRISGRELIKRLGKAGFLPQRTEGDHQFLKHPDGRAVTVPLDPEIGPGLMSDIMNELKMSREDFLKLLLDPKRYAKEHSGAT